MKCFTAHKLHACLNIPVRMKKWSQKYSLTYYPTPKGENGVLFSVRVNNELVCLYVNNSTTLQSWINFFFWKGVQ